jgi:hypothetical protein
MRLIPEPVLLGWPSPNYVDPPKNPATVAVYVFNGFFLTLATITVAARLYTRIIIRNWFGLDDLFIILAFVRISPAILEVFSTDTRTVVTFCRRCRLCDTWKCTIRLESSRLGHTNCDCHAFCQTRICHKDSVVSCVMYNPHVSPLLLLPSPRALPGQTAQMGAPLHDGFCGFGIGSVLDCHHFCLHVRGQPSSFSS